MDHITLFIPVSSPALERSEVILSEFGYSVVHRPGHEVTHVLLPVPSFGSDGLIRGGGDLNALLDDLPRDVVIIGGNLDHPVLDRYRHIDLLQDPHYLWENAVITAHCALKYILNTLPVTLPGQQVLIMGWGRIGKSLAPLLRRLGAVVTVSARKPEDRAMIQALGYQAIDCQQPGFSPADYRIIVNTAPAPVLSAQRCRPDCYLLDLASRLGIMGEKVIWARGLPGKDAPESSGELIAKTVRHLFDKEASI